MEWPDVDILYNDNLLAMLFNVDVKPKVEHNKLLTSTILFDQYN